MREKVAAQIGFGSLRESHAALACGFELSQDRPSKLRNGPPPSLLERRGAGNRWNGPHRQAKDLRAILPTANALSGDRSQKPWCRRIPRQVERPTRPRSPKRRTSHALGTRSERCPKCDEHLRPSSGLDIPPLPLLRPEAGPPFQ